MKKIYRWDKSSQPRHGIKSYTYALFMVLLLCVVPTTMLAAMDSPKLSEPALQQSYTWFDGPIERKVWLNPHLVAEFSPGPEEQSPVKLTYGDYAIALPESKAFVRFWQLDGVTPEIAIASLKASYPIGMFSPVFHDVPSLGVAKRALPGNIIVFFNPSWQDSQVNQWILSKGFKIVNKLAIGAQTYIIKTGPGLEALETANDIYKSGVVNTAMPVWWEEAFPR